MKAGCVYLVGAGPGDEGLLTIRGRELLEQADVIVYDRLGAEGFLHLANPHCQLIDAGKEPGKHTIRQEGINRILCNLAAENKRIVRLKGGDPFLFGRGGEEAQALKQAGIPFEIVPGVSSFYAACAYGGIPVTHRGVSPSVHVFTGHGATKRSLDFETMSKLSGTLVFLMAMGNLDYICNGLLSQGKESRTPAAIIEWGTTSRQRELFGTLGNIGLLAKEKGFQNPAVVVIGGVAALAAEIGWQKYRPLWGKRILLTGRRETVKEAVEWLQDEGAAVTVWPAGVSVIAKNDQFRQAVEEIDSFSWIFFTSSMGVDAFFERMQTQKVDRRRLASIRFFCIGEKTSQALEGKGFYADYIPKQWNSKEAAKELCHFLKPEDRILFPASSLAHHHLEQAAEELGAKVCRVTAYTTTPPESEEQMPLALTEKFDAIGFFSPSQVAGLWQVCRQDFKGARLFPIGTTTRQALLDLGLTPEREGGIPTGHCLAKRILEELGGNYGL